MSFIGTTFLHPNYLLLFVFLLGRWKIRKRMSEGLMIEKSLVQQWRSPDEINLLLLVHAMYVRVWVLFFAHIPLVVNRPFNAMSTDRLQQPTWINAWSLSQA